jgi:hypothetical protein
MADVFVSYAKTDRPLASKLVAMLEAEGWKVWWDTSLATADLYRDEIMKQLASARAVIAIWTPNSIRSDWVRAEAGRAKRANELCSLRWSQIDLRNGRLHVNRAKGGIESVHPLVQRGQRIEKANYSLMRKALEQIADRVGRGGGRGRPLQREFRAERKIRHGHSLRAGGERSGRYGLSQSSGPSQLRRGKSITTCHRS